ncbi:recombination-associated protein RdgC [Caldichromatium japonicum]|uniref:Recombination-associated protein RdgC n=1 Tax=Caldichromatium japonicum TaxID=2699430 RepID=A0A6G7VA76_9GAMM|nr:recombination-associated protein RdgC [Caldichromatium japonicum]QIK36775.1 recombination-associated protein RdgC [Caldichromatium japonicum]
MLRNARLFWLEPEDAPSADELAEVLAARPFRPCGPLELASQGWIPPLGEETAALVHTVSQCHLICARRQERLLPAAAVNEALAERISAIEAEELRPVGRAERRRLREQLIDTMLPHAFTRSRLARLYLDAEGGWLVVDAASNKQAEELVSLLRETLGSLPIRRPMPQRPVVQTLTTWLLDGEVPEGFALGDACELREGGEQGGVVRCSRQDLLTEEVRHHLRAGKQVTRLALVWDEGLSFVLSEDLALRRLRLADALLEGLDDDEMTPAQRLDAEFALLSLQLRALLGRFAAIFGLERA